jgi:integrase
MNHRTTGSFSLPSIYDRTGHRKYLTPQERQSFAKMAARGPRDTYAFCLILLHTGARISEALSLTCGHLDTDIGSVVLPTLKKRRSGVFRSVPVPGVVLREAKLMAQRNRNSDVDPLWRWSRTTAWKEVKAVMLAAQINGPHASPRGLRHGFGVAAVQAGVPLNLVRKWLGHASISTTAIYTDAVGAEERTIASRIWLHETDLSSLGAHAYD